MRDKVVIITGASSGIGRACAKKFASYGAKVVIAARRIHLLNELEKEIQATHATEVLVVQTDVSIEEDCNRLIVETVGRFGRIDILINNAGVSMRALYHDMELIVLKKVMDVNFWGNAYCTKFALPHLLESKGSVIAISSVSGYSALPARTAYCASKSAIHGFMDALRIENRKTGLHVMVVAPGFTSSEIRKNALAADGSVQGKTPRDESKMQSPERVAKRIVHGIRRRKRTMILSNLGWWTIAFNKFVPGFVDWCVYTFFSKEDNSPVK